MSSVFPCTASCRSHPVRSCFTSTVLGRLTKMQHVPSTSHVCHSALPSYLPSQPSPAFLNTHLVHTNFPPTSAPHLPLLPSSTHLTSSPTHPPHSPSFPPSITTPYHPLSAATPATQRRFYTLHCYELYSNLGVLSPRASIPSAS